MAKKSSRKTLWVRSSDGKRQRFLRGIVTHHLVEVGIDFDAAYAVARAVRDQLAQRDEVDTTELRELVALQVEESLGPEASLRLATPARSRRRGPVVIAGGRPQPFSRGLLARSINAAGPGLDRAYRLVQEVEKALLEESHDTVASDELARRVGDLLERMEGPEVARRYRLVRRLRRLPRPLVIYVGGASGTGKSTLAVELAPLLRIYRITATDTIRQVMRMLFSPQILPALHRSSFDRAFPGQGHTLLDELLGIDEDDPEHRALAAFVEQSVRVTVGVRAVVERAITENLSVIVEGVHLFPPLVPFADLEGSCYQVPLVLGLPDDEAHRARFLARARLGGRRAERYVENFESIRSVQDLVLEQAEAEDVPTLDTTMEDTAARALRLITGVLEERVPRLAVRRGDQQRHPVLLVAIDGIADRPTRTLGGRTPLQAASTPTLDRLALEGRCGLADAVAPGVVPDTAAGTLALFAQSPLALQRGPVEALGASLALSTADVALRGNFATLDERGQVVDRRAGRIREEAEELARALDRLDLPGSLADEVEVRVRAATEHRLAIVLKGHGLSSAIRGSDPGDGAIPCPPLAPAPVDPGDERAVYTARAVALFEQRAREILDAHPINKRRTKKGLPAANLLLTRGAGHVHRLVPLEEDGVPLRVTCVAGDLTILGIARWLGAELVTSDTMTANLDTNLDEKFAAAAGALVDSDLVVVHLKGADIAAHDMRPDRKAEFLEAVDEALARLLEARHDAPLRIAIGGDHATLSESGQHAADPLPVLIWGPSIEADTVDAYDETSVAGGALGRFPLQALLGRLFQLA
ncbi:MAG: ATP cone domain-containing protein [Acidobacteriota bacterium]